LAGIVVHWRNEAQLAALLAAWPAADPRFALLVVDNSGTASEAAAPAGVRWLRPGRNLGFGGGVNFGVAATGAPLVLLLNPDVVPEPGALESLLAGFAAHPEAAGLAPRLSGPAGEPQFSWQLHRLPALADCLRQTLPWPGAGTAAGPRSEPPAGSAVEQPAAAALALRRAALAAVGGFDPRFQPAWFEDVDLALRLRTAGLPLLYWPAARFRHGLGGTVAQLGYGRFLWIYHRNLERYIAKHHGTGWALAARCSLALGLAVRLPLTLLRRPRRAASRREGAAGLLLALRGALSGWRLPQRMAEASRPLSPLGVGQPLARGTLQTLPPAPPSPPAQPSQPSPPAPPAPPAT
jgi:N-acetylglucosaminyl-diphospho-decaprenol L-rhamnosyltransferase